MKNYTDISQSKKLAEILPLESADGGWYGTNNPLASNTTFWLYTKYSNKAAFPAWSLTALFGVLPKIGAHEPMLRKLYYISEPTERYICQYSLTDMTSEYDNPIDACVEMVIKLHELNLL